VHLEFVVVPAGKQIDGVGTCDRNLELDEPGWRIGQENDLGALGD
jgi:hypothetical protein